MDAHSGGLGHRRGAADRAGGARAVHGAVVLIGAILYVVTRRVTRPLQTHGADDGACRAGRVGVRLPITPTRDEVGRLSRVFNTMLDSLERLITQVYQAQLREKDAQLLALQTQINPHFLFNTLNSMRGLSRNGSEAVATIAESLAELFRYSMSNWNEPVPLHESWHTSTTMLLFSGRAFGHASPSTVTCRPSSWARRGQALDSSHSSKTHLSWTDRRRNGLAILVRASRDETTLRIEVIITLWYRRQYSSTAAGDAPPTRWPRPACRPRGGIVCQHRSANQAALRRAVRTHYSLDRDIGTIVEQHLPYQCGQAPRAAPFRPATKQESIGP